MAKPYRKEGARDGPPPGDPRLLVLQRRQGGRRQQRGRPAAQAQVVPGDVPPRRRPGAAGGAGRRSAASPPAALGAAGLEAVSRWGALGPDWVEGTGDRLRSPRPGSSTFQPPAAPRRPLDRPTAATSAASSSARAGPLWRMADASPPDARGLADRRRRPVGRRRPGGRDQPGVPRSSTTPARSGPATARRSPSSTCRTASSTAAIRTRASAPYLTVDARPRGPRAPRRPAEPPVPTPADLPAGRGAGLVGHARATTGPAGTVGFFVTIDGKDRPRVARPARRRRPASGCGCTCATSAWRRGRGRARGPRGRRRGERRARPADGDGPRLRPAPPRRCPASRPGAVAAAAAPLPKLGGAEVAVLDELDKVQPVDGRDDPRPRPRVTSPPITSGTPRASRPAPRGAERVRRLPGRRQRAGDRGVRPALTFEGPAGRRSGPSSAATALVDSQAGRCPTRSSRSAAPRTRRDPGGRSQSLHAEVYVPHDAAAGEHTGTLTLTSGGQSLDARGRPAGLGLHAARRPQLPARDELLRPAGRTSATSTGSPTGTGRS